MESQAIDAVKKAPASQPPVGFLDLSAELRNKIYRLVLCAEMEKDGVIWLNWSQEGDALFRLDDTPYQLTPAILRTCKQVHAEGTSILYGEHSFAMTPETLLKIVPRHSDFTTQTRFLRLWLSPYDVSDLAYVAQCRISASTIERTCNAFGKMNKLRELSLGGEIQREFFYYAKPSPLGATMAKNLWPTVEQMLMRSGRAEVRKVLEVGFRPGFFGTLFLDESRHLQERLDIMQEYAYERLEASRK